MALTKDQATALGCIAPVMWGLSVSLVRVISQIVGVEAGLTLTYLCAVFLVGFFFGVPNLKLMPLKYYIFGLGSALTCAVTFAFSLSTAANGTQTMEVGMINYLWPSLTMVFAVIFNKQPAKWWVYIGIVLAIYGICMVLSGTLVVNFVQMYEHLLSNPISYFMGLISAVSWAAYSNFTKAWANGQNPTILIFGLDFVAFSLIWAFSDSTTDWSLEGFGVVIALAVVIGSAYGLWTLGVQKGRINILSIASFFTPVLSCVFASILIGADLNNSFWAGVGVVVFGSFICWMATKGR